MGATENRRQDRPRRFRPPGWLLGIAVALALVAVSGAVALKALFPPEKLRALVVPQLESRAGRDVELASVHLRVFPRIAVRLQDLAIANPPGFGSGPAVQVDALELQVRFWPLLRRELELGRVRLERPIIRYEVREDGTNNLEGLGAATGEEGSLSASQSPRRDTAAPGAQAAAAAGFVVEDLVLRDGTVYYADRRSGRSARMSLGARVSATRAAADGRALLSRGEVEIGSIRALVPALGEDSVDLPDLTIGYEAFADRSGDSLALNELEVELGGVPLSGSGSVHGLRGARSIDFSMESGELDIARLLADLPAALRAADVKAAGRARLSLRATGQIGAGAAPAIDGSVALENMSAEYGEYGRLLSNGSGLVRFDMGSLSIAPLKGDVLGRPIELVLSVTDFDDPAVDGHVSGSIDLARIAELREGTQPAEGELAFDLDLAGRAKEPASLRLTGPVRLSDVSYRSASLAVPARIESASLQLTGTGVRAEAIPIELGRSDLTLSLASRNLVTFVLNRGAADYQPFVEFSARSRRLDLGELTVDKASVGYSQLLSARLAGRKLEGRDPGEIARERYPDLELPPVNASGRVEIGELLNPPTRASEVGFDVTVNNGVLEVKDLRGRAYGGQLTGGLALDFSRGQPPFTLRYDLSLRAAQATDFLGRWTRLGSAVSGLMDFDISGTSSVDETLLPAPQSIDAAGQVSFREGRFQNFGLTNALVKRFGLDSDRLSGFRELGGAFAIERGAVLVDNWQFSGRDLTGGVSGSAGLGGSLDLRLALQLPASTLEKAGLVQSAGGLGNLVSQLAGDDEAVQVAVGVGGTMASPTLKLDSEALQKELAKRLEQSGKDLLKKLLKKPPPN